MKKLQSFNSFISEKKTDLWSPYQKADILAGDMFGEMGLFSLRDDQLDQIIDLKKADKLAKKHFGEFGFKTLAAKEMEELIDNNPKLLRESVITENKESMKIDSYLSTKDEDVLIDFLDDAYGNSDDRKTRKEWEDARNDLSYGELVDYAVAHAEDFGMDLQDIEDAIEVYEAKTINERKTISFAKASMMGAKILNKINIGTILDTKGGQYEITDYGQQANAFKEFEAEKDGKIVKVKLTAMYGLKLEVTDDVRSARFNKEEEIIGFIMESVVNEAKIKIVKDEWPYLEFKVGGKLHKVDFDYEDIIDDHGNEGQDQYWVGKDEKGQDWMIDVYADYNGEVEEVWYDTIVKESAVVEAATPAIYVQDERQFGKKGIIIMINDHGDVTSAIFKDKKNADKYNRNKTKDLKDLLKLAKGVKYPNPIDEQFLTEGKWSNIMKGVRKGAKAGPWAIVSIENGKVINQELVSIMDAIPAHYEAVKKEFPKAKLSIEDNEGHIVYNESLLIEISEKFTFGKKDKFSDNDINDVYGFYGTLDTLYDDAQKEEFWKNTFSYLVSSFGFTDEGALYFLNAKVGRWLADQFADSNVTMGNDGVFDVIDNFAKSSQWKKWAKEFNDVATEEMANESAIYETFDNGLNEEKSSTEVLADDVSGELYTATLKGKSVTVKATTTTKTWDDGVPVLKYLARGKGKSIKVELNRSFDVVHDVAHGWFYFTDGRKWFGMHQSDGYGEADDLPFNVVIKESKLIKEAKMDRDDFIDHLKMKFSLDFVSTTEEFNGSEGGVWVSGESGDVYKGKIIYDYYSEDHKNYELGVLNKFEKQINKIGWYSEWYDAGTVMIWPL